MPGKTYSKRLWYAATAPRRARDASERSHRPSDRCVIELFTFLRSGHDRTKIKVYQLTASEDDDVTASFTTFDASKAQCHKKSDRERLLAVIESGFGDFRPFNRLVRGIFAKPRKSQLAVFNPVNQVAQSV